MVEGEDALFRPVGRFYMAPALLDCSIDLQFVMLCNEAIDIEAENTRRAERSTRAQAAARNNSRRR